MAIRWTLLFLESSRRLLSRAHRGGGALHGIDDSGVGAAAAQVGRWRRVGESILDLSHRWIRVLGEQLHRDDHHAALAVAALRNLLIDPRLLDRVQRAGSAQTLLRRPNG